MKTKAIMAAIVLTAIMFGLTATVVLACDSDCELGVPQYKYQNNGEFRPNQQF